METLVLIIVGVLGVGVGMSLGHKDSGKRLGNFINKERSPQKGRRKKMLLKHIKDQGELTNSEAQVLLGVSDTTIVTYLDELEEEGKVVQVGESGRGVYYTLV
ncbi:winged helix-turn-helix transcriptional regulator [Candidatus Kaiserbacteria bacterium]|nr:winged helix-turn-helix transcriptional regulator [Candidatus Kaiserbacteria bacterium]